jgi:hypothetical protein
MYTCAIEVSPKCFGTNVGHRGICSNCYKQLVKEGIIKDGDKFEDFPLWLQEVIRTQDALDHSESRHPTENYSEIGENSFLGNNKGQKLPKMPTSV